MGDRWWEAEHPCMSFSCSAEGIQTVTKVCPAETCQEVRNPSIAATTVTQYLTCDAVLTDFCDTRRTGYGIINTAALHVSPIKTCENWKRRLIIIAWVRGGDDTLVLQATRAAHPSWPVWTSPSATVAVSHWCLFVRVDVRRSRGEMEITTSQNLISHGFLTRPGSLWISRVVFDGILQVEQTCQSCQKRRSERRPLTLQCLDLTSRTYVYEHITACDCRDCGAAETPAG